MSAGDKRVGGINMSEIEEAVIEKIRERAEIGKQKYGVTMAEATLSIQKWLKHLQEELMDASVYVEKLMNIMEDVE